MPAVDPMLCSARRPGLTWPPQPRPDRQPLHCGQVLGIHNKAPQRWPSPIQMGEGGPEIAVPGVGVVFSIPRPPQYLRLKRTLATALALSALVALSTACHRASDDFDAATATQVQRPPRLRPDYADTVIPPNIAPLNFLVEEPGESYRVRVRARQGTPINLLSGSAEIRIPPDAWHRLLRGNAGDMIVLEVGVRDATGRWSAFRPITNQVAAEAIDRTLTYRLLKPLYSFYSELGIYERDLEGHRQEPLLENRHFSGGCLNCHTPCNRRPDQFALHIRGQPGVQPMLLVRSNVAVRVDKTAGYLAWHPSGRLLTFSANKLSLFFHTMGETRDVFDEDSNLGVYWLDSNTLSTPAPVALPDRLETWPAWSPDGRFLYFCSAPKLRRERFRQVRYDLLRVAFDLGQNTWGEPELLVSAAETGRSAAQPRVSPDGRWLLFCLARYGNFPIYQPSSDLYLMDLGTRTFRRLEINSDQADTWHSWSGNSRWVVFSSKRGNGLFARPHFSYVDAAGRFHKPLVLPQEDPTFYDACLQTFNLPEFVDGWVETSPVHLARALRDAGSALKPAGAEQQSHREEQYVPPPEEQSTSKSRPAAK